MVTAGAPAVPAPLVDQLAEGGILVIPVGDASQQTLVSLSKYGGRTTERRLIACRFVKLVGRDAWC
jgi:protein-L-isoaspartate(D-aspartate) O-methyltransferase